MAACCGPSLAEAFGKQHIDELKDVAKGICIRSLGIAESDDPNFDVAAAAAWLFTRCVGYPNSLIYWETVPELYIFCQGVH